MRSENKDKLIFCDYVLFVITFVCPYLDNGVWSTATSFLPVFNSLGSQFLSFVLSLIIFQHSIRYNYKVCDRTFYIMVFLAALWSIIKLLQTMSIVGFGEAMTIYRRNYILMPTYLLCLSYICNISLSRFELLAKMAVKFLFFCTLLFMLQNLGFALFSSDVHVQTVNGISVNRNILGLPNVEPVLLAFFFIRYLYCKSEKMLYLSLLCIAIVFISYTRNFMAETVMIIILALLFHMLKYGVSEKISKIVVVTSILAIFSMMAFPEIFSYWKELIDSTVNSQLVNNKGTYAFRQDLIQDAIDANTVNNSMMTGIGYVRDAAKGEYSYVLGGDTYIAPILHCEGVIGLILRCLPCMYLLFKTFSIFRATKNKEIGMYAMMIIVCILPMIPNYVQTTIFVKYNNIMSLLFMIYVVLQAKIREKNNTKKIC